MKRGKTAAKADLAQERRRAPWAAPRLNRYGAVAELTAAGSAGPQEWFFCDWDWLNWRSCRERRSVRRSAAP
ncbi:MAG: hypothetical protein KatS3mg124_0713 [Porticoccaceae bacterium]|nr:MAG: hypothetical protein KatS3mg124_0713 [Porticoccaceae bacterium]